MAYVEPPDRLRRVGAVVAVLLLVVAALLAGVVAWELLRAGENGDRSRTVAAIPGVAVTLPPRDAAAPVDQTEPEATVAPIASEVSAEPITEPRRASQFSNGADGFAASTSCRRLESVIISA